MHAIVTSENDVLINNWFICTSACVHRDMKQVGSLESTKMHKSCLRRSREQL